MVDRPTRIQRLSFRVRWLDRYRRALAIIATLVITPWLMAKLGDVLGPDWSEVYAVIVGAMVGFVMWWILEAALAGVTALWETECSQLEQTHELPRAVLLRK